MGASPNESTLGTPAHIEAMGLQGNHFEAKRRIEPDSVLGIIVSLFKFKYHTHESTVSVYYGILWYIVVYCGIL